MPWLWQVAGHPERLPLLHHQRTLQDGRWQGQFPGDKEQVLGPALQAARAGTGD